MRNIDCRSVHREIDGVGTGDFLSPAARIHLQSCPACESLARKQTNLRTILSGLEMVETPSDFGFRVRARLAAEREASARTTLGSFSFGVRAAAVSMVLFIVAAGFVFVNFRSQVNPTPNPIAVNGDSSPANKAVTTPDSKVVAATTTEAATDAGVVATIETPRRRFVRSNKASRIGTQDFGLTQAAVLKPSNGIGDGNPNAFPINASYQSLKVSVDDGHGSSRTISLPTVSFGSQRTVSQNATPLMASARGVW